MKCITYVSNVVASKYGSVIPIGLADIFSAARKKNAAAQVTGILSYRGGHYIQVIEGDNEIVDQLFSKIRLDPRHQHVTVLLDFEISQRSLPKWAMKLLESVNKDASFLTFMDRNKRRVCSLDNTQRQLLEIFYDLKGSSLRSKQTYDGKNLMLLAWPDFTAIRLSPTIIELCAQLIKQPYPYNGLLEGQRFGTQQQLDELLNKFDELEILNITDSPKHNIEVNQVGSPTRFYSKMKTFLGLR